ncbi:hypothetical protein [Rossellomorea vietnamensis]|uniref:hypothetical protein n=1 Tax=Rossellomorea vietnamensis TaxID=218284 RepID=UPI003CEAADEB
MLYIIKFPILGPAVSGASHLAVILGTLVFSVLYSAICYRISTLGIKELDRMLAKGVSLGR